MSGVLLALSFPRYGHPAVAFIALLTLLRQRVINVRQVTLFGDIEIERLASFKPADD